MKTELESITAVKKRLKIEIDSSEVDKKLDDAFRELRKSATIAGFRPGKAPRAILERRFGGQVVDDVSRDLINESFPKAIEELNAYPLGTPMLEKEILKRGHNFKYSAVLEVRPEFDLNDYIGIEVDKEKLDISEADVDQQLEQIRLNHGTLNSVEDDRAIQQSDHVLFNYEAFDDDKALEDIKGENTLVKVGDNDFHPQFEQALIGLKKNDQSRINVTYEQDFPHKQLAGKRVTFSVKILDIKELDLPELNDDFAAKLGGEFEDFEDLKNKIRKGLVREEERRIDREMKRRILQKLSEKVEFELPESLVQAEIEYALDNLRKNLARQGSNLKKAGISEEKFKKDFRPTASRRVKDMFMLGEIAKREEMAVSEEELNEGFRDLAASTGQSVETVKRYYEARGMVESLRESLLEEKTLNYLVKHAKVSIVERGVLQQQNFDEKEKS